VTSRPAVFIDFDVQPDHVATDLLDAVDWVLARRVAA
jgi:hypothetical protein